MVVLTANGDIPALYKLLIASGNVKLELILRILLTYLPEGTDPGVYVSLLQQLSTYEFASLDPPLCAENTQDLIEDEARQKVRRLRLLPLAHPRSLLRGKTDPLTIFLIHQAYKIEKQTGSLNLVCRLLEPFIDHSEVLQTWMVSVLLPLLRLEYEYYPHSAHISTLEEFEELDGRAVVEKLLSKATHGQPGEKIDIGRDLRGIVGPWVYGERMRKRRKISVQNEVSTLPNEPTAVKRTSQDSDRGDWEYVNEWLVDFASQNFQHVVDTVVQWQGPGDVDYGEWGGEILLLDTVQPHEQRTEYTRACLASVYSTDQASFEAVIGTHRILQQVVALNELDEPPDIKRSDTSIKSGIPQKFFEKISRAHLLHNNLLRHDNPLTQPSATAVAFLNIVVASTYKLINLGSIASCQSVTKAIINSAEDDHRAELRRALFRLQREKLDENRWSLVRRQLLWLRNWEAANEDLIAPRGVFSKVSTFDIENEMLRAMLDTGCYTLPVKIYCKEDSPLPGNVLKESLLHTALSAYDAASNGNRTRGGVRKASDIISAFQSYYPDSQQFAQVQALLSATHAMSFYSLTLQPGVPFQPVNIRAHKDPMSLIGKILNQNPRSYTHLDDLLEIGQNLVSAGLGQSSQGSDQTAHIGTNLKYEKVIARRRVTRMAIEAALAEDDFDTSYSYIVNRLHIEERQNVQSVSEFLPLNHDDISWRAAYAAGRYNARASSGASPLRRLEQRMELLSQALLLAPPSALSELLIVWQKCEKQMLDLAAQESEEEEQLQEHKERVIPGGFSGSSSPPIQKPRDSTKNIMQEEAPMGLFDVARGAAAAFSKSAFTVRPGQKAPAAGVKAVYSKPLGFSSDRDVGTERDEPVEEQTRVRKRDMVSNMVTGGLVSGIGWVIGMPSINLISVSHR